MRYLAPQLDHRIWDRVVAEDPDLFLFLGDNVYESEERSEPELREDAGARRSNCR